MTELTHPEQITSPRESLAHSFARARDSVLDAPHDPVFRQRLIDRGIGIGETDPAYWTALEEYQYDRSQSEGIDEQDAYTHILAGMVPSAILHTKALESRPPYRESKEHKLALSNFNGLIRSFASNHPDTTVPQLTAELHAVANVTVAHSGNNLSNTAEDLINSAVRGAQHELVFEQILAASGFEYRPATPEEDLKGADYVIIAPSGQEIKLDVKASLTQIDGKNYGSNGLPYAVDHRGNITTYSGFTDTELRGRFQAPADLVAARLPLLLGALAQSSRKIA